MLPDGHILCLNAKDGTVRWKVEVADVNKGYWTTMAPLVVGNHVIVGVAGDMDNLPAISDPSIRRPGALQWQWNSHSARGNSEQCRPAA